MSFAGSDHRRLFADCCEMQTMQLIVITANRDCYASEHIYNLAKMVWRRVLVSLEDYEIDELVNEHGAEILQSDGMLTEKRFIQHGVTSTYDHSVSVAKTAVKIADSLGLQDKVDWDSLVKAALLHDYFLYDWHVDEPWHRMHGFTHGHTALLNAERDFRDDLNWKVRDSIERHMFPLTKTPPAFTEGWLVTAADKTCAWMETFDADRMHRKKILENRVLDSLPLVESAAKPVADWMIEDKIRKMKPGDTGLVRRGAYKGLAWARKIKN